MFDSDLPDPQLVVVEGQAQVVPGAAEDQGLVVTSRRELLEQLGGTPPSGQVLDDLAAALESAVNNLGG